jgi:hypothetical protein
MSPGRAGAAASELASRLGDRGIPIGQRQLLATQFGQVANDAVLQRAVAERQAEAAEDREEEEESLLTAAQALRLDASSIVPVQRVPPAAAGAAMTAAEWIGLGAAGYVVAQDAVSGTAGDTSYTFDEMEGVLLPDGGNDVAAYRKAHPDAKINSYRHTISVWQGTGSRKMGIKFGLSFSYDGHAIGNMSCDIIDTYDWPMWSGNVHVNFTPLSLATGGVSRVRITVSVNADRTFAGGMVRSRILEINGTSLIQTTGSGAPVRFGE